MKSKTLMVVRGEPVNLKADGSITFRGGMTIDADGSPHAYHPANKGLDYLGNAGHPGNWWGIVTDSRGKPYIQTTSDPAPGFYVSATTYERKGFQRRDPKRYLDSEKVRFIVIPGPLRRLVRPVLLGCRAVVTSRDRQCEAVVGDIGPASHLGEASIACAKALGIGSNPKRGGCESGVIYQLFPGVAADGFELQPA